MADPDREIDAVLDEIDHAILEPQLARHFGIALQIGRHHGANMEAPESDRRRDHEPSARLRALALGRALGFLDISEDASCALQIACADIGQRHAPRRPLQQPRAETILQRRDHPRYTRGRQPELARRRRKTLEVGHRHEGLHGVDTIHGIISTIAMMKCQYA